MAGSTLLVVMVSWPLFYFILFYVLYGWHVDGAVVSW